MLPLLFRNSVLLKKQTCHNIKHFIILKKNVNLLGEMFSNYVDTVHEFIFFN